MFKVFSNDFNQSMEEIKPHDHLSLVYESDDALFTTIGRFFKVGFERGDRCYAIGCEEESRDFLANLKISGFKADSVINSGQLIFLPIKKTPLSMANFNKAEVVSFLESLSRDSLQEGYSSISFTIDMAWILEGHFSIEKLLNFESILNDYFIHHPACGICQYDRGQFKPEIILQILKTHRLIIHKQGIYTNPFYIPPNQYDSTSQAERDVNSMLAGLRDLKHWENELVTTIKNLRYLVEINKAISGSTDMDKVVIEVLNNLIDHMGADGVGVMIFDPDCQELAYYSTRGFLDKYALEEIHLTPQQFYSGWSALDYEPLIIKRKEGSLQLPSHLDRLQDEPFDVYIAYPLIIEGEIRGVLEIYVKDSQLDSDTWQPYIKVLVSQLSNAIDNAQSYETLQQKIFELTMAYDMTIARFAEAMEKRNNRISRSTQRVAEITEELARKMGADEEALVHIRRGVLLKSISKMSLPDKILKKAGPLNEQEWDIMHKHPQVIFDLLEDIKVLRPALEIPYCHHEHWDGSGYPRGLKGEEIPLAARQFAVVNVYDALLTDRPYRPSWEEMDALAYIRSLSGSQFDPGVVDAFMEMIDQE